jgi:hypothetical protein
MDQSLGSTTEQATPKPICFIRYNQEAFDSANMSVTQINEHLQNKMADYHVFAVPTSDSAIESIDFQVFHAKDITETDIESIRELIITTLNSKNSSQC